MKLLQDKSWFFNLFVIIVLTAGAGNIISRDGFSLQLEHTRFSDLSDADIDMFLAVKNEMHQARIQAN